MRVLVTGGAGFIGSNFVRYLLENKEDTVVTLDALSYAGTRENLGGVLDHPRHEFIEGDIRDLDLVEELIGDVDEVVNFAAESHVDRSIESAEPFVSTNVQGTQTLLDASRDANLDRFVQVSTDEVYGDIESGTFHEDDSLNPRNPYAATKAAADHLAISYYETHGVPVVITRSSNNYGPRQHEEKLIPKLISRADNNQPLPIYGDGSNVREWTHVSDNCRGIELVRRKGKIGNVYNIGSGHERTNLEVAKTIIEHVGADESLIEFVPDRPGHDKRYALDSNKLRNLGWEPSYDFEDGIDQTIHYYLE